MPRSARPWVEVRQLAKAFGYRPVLQGIDLDLARAECVALRGVNGAGKSTLLRILAGVARCDRGTVRWAGSALAPGDYRWRARIGYVTQSNALQDALSLWQQLDVAARAYGMIDPEPRMRSLMRSAGLEAVRDVPAGELSRGLQQRGTLCRAWLPDPRLLLLDEPEAHLDGQGIAFLGFLIAARKTARQTILFATHRADLAARWADREIWLERGQRSGPPAP